MDVPGAGSVFDAVLADPGAPDPAAVARCDRSRRAVAALTEQIAGWLDSRAEDSRFARFTAHLAVLRTVYNAMLGALTEQLAAVQRNASPSGEVYATMRSIDAETDIVRRMFDWYAGKYDQRIDPLVGDTLRAADELVRSCWRQPFAALGRATVPPGPLTYVDARYDAVATPRQSVPGDLRAPADAIVAEFVRQLPIPVIALPSIAADEPWWLVLAVHESAHHLHYDLDTALVSRTQALLLSAGGDHGADWYGWALEAFADAASVLLVGPAATWAVAELQFGTAAQLSKLPQSGDRYPPPIVRLAFMGEIGRLSGYPEAGPAVADVRLWCESVLSAGPERAAALELLATVPEVARAMLDLKVDGRDLATLCATEAAAHGPAGRVAQWAARLPMPTPHFSDRQRLSAARTAIAAGVTAHLATPHAASAKQAMIGDNLRTLLLRCGPEGVLAGGTGPDVSALAAELTSQLLRAGVQEQ